MWFACSLFSLDNLLLRGIFKFRSRIRLSEYRYRYVSNLGTGLNMVRLRKVPVQYAQFLNTFQEKYSGIRPGTGRLASPATFETPQEPLRDNDPHRPPSSLSDVLREDSSSRNGDGEKKDEEEKMNLDKFLANHTSEDNESFIEIQEEAFQRHK